MTEYKKIASIRELLKQKTTGELEILLDSELHSENVEEDTVRVILGILRERDKAIQPEITPEMKTAWIQYRNDTARYQKRVSGVRRFRSGLIRAASVAAVFAVLLSVIPSQVGAQSFWERFIRRTNEILEFFGFSDNEDRMVEYVFHTDNPGLQELYNTVAEQGITEPMVPMWLPEGYVLDELKIEKLPEKTMIYSKFSHETVRFTYQMHIYDAVYSHKYQKDETDKEVLELDGTKYYILRNNDMWSVVWTKENVECSIFADCREEVLHQILASI